VRPAPPRSYFAQPFNRLLGTDGRVRVLRELASTAGAGALSVTTLARRTRLTAQAVRNTLAELQAAGIVDPLGQGRAMSYRLDATHPFAPALGVLFEAERERVATVLDAARAAAATLAPSPHALWLYGSVARGADTEPRPLELALCADSAVLDDQAAALAARLRPVEAAQRVRITLVALTLAEAARLAATRHHFWTELARETTVLHGAAPAALLQRADAARSLGGAAEKGEGR